MATRPYVKRAIFTGNRDQTWRALQVFLADATSESADSGPLPATGQQKVLESRFGHFVKTSVQACSDEAFDGGTLVYTLNPEKGGTELSLALGRSGLRPRISSPFSWLAARRFLNELVEEIKANVQVESGVDSDSNGSSPAIPLQIPGLPAQLSLFVHETRQDIHVSDEIRRNGIWEEYETEVVGRLLKAGDIFVDVGANIGYYTALASCLVSEEGNVYSFEPDPDNYALLRKNADFNGLDNAHVVNAALSSNSSEGKLYLSPDNCGDHQIHAANEDRDFIPIPLLNGSNFLREHTSRADFIKIDTQGAEVDVIKGLLPLIRSSLPNLIMITEFWPNGLRRAGRSGEALLELLLEAGFETFVVVEHGERALIATSEEELRKWIAFAERDPDCDGFINLMCTMSSTEITGVEQGGFFPRRSDV